jgi:Ni/Co efflux regulator RcnB
MKSSFLTTVFALALALAPQAAAQTKGTPQKTETRTETRTQREIEREAERQAERDREERRREDEEARREGHKQSAAVERTSSADAQAVISLCLSQGDVIVRGWDKTEVRARAEGVGNVRLLTPNAQPAPRVEVLVADDEDVEPDSGDCGSADQVELMVPRGSTINVRTQNGHVDVSDISDARVETLSGDVDLRRVTKAVLVSCLNGDVMVSDVSGPVRATTVSGSVEARNARSLSAGDGFEAKSTSGDVTIENVRHSEVIAATISGSLLYTGALARGGAYDFRTISGDVTLELPPDSSFTLHAKVVVSGDIDTDFPVKTMLAGGGVPAAGSPGGPPSPPGAPLPSPNPMPAPQGVRVKPGKIKTPKEPEQVRLDGTVGSGDATVNMSSFSGSLHLRKQ